MKIQDIPRSGSVNSQTSSRNRFGQYVRRRAVPVNPASDRQTLARSVTQANAAEWRNLTDSQRAGWIALGAQMTRADSLGNIYTLTGLQAFLSINNTRLANGQARTADAPAMITPDPLSGASLTLNAAAFSIAFTPTPLGADEQLQIWASPPRSAGRSFEGDYRLIQVTPAAAASPVNVKAAYEQRFGPLPVGARIFVRLFRTKNGFSSQPLSTHGVVAP
jgi:hypothetical protein